MTDKLIIIKMISLDTLLSSYISLNKLMLKGPHSSVGSVKHNNFQYVCCYQDIRSQRFAVLTPKNPYYVRYDVYYGMIRLRLKSSIPLLKPISNY